MGHALTAIFPEHPWDLHRLGINKSTPLSPIVYPFGETEIAERQQLLTDIGRKIGVFNWTDWYKVDVAKVVELGASFISFPPFEGFLLRALSFFFRERIWTMSDYDGFWKDIYHQRFLFDLLASQLRIINVEDWYKVSLASITTVSPSLHYLITTQYARRIDVALLRVYPEHSWNRWYFTDPFIWSDRSVQRSFMEELGRHLNYTEWQHFYSVSTFSIISLN